MAGILRLHAVSILGEDFGGVLEVTCRFFAPFGVEVKLLSQEYLGGYPSALPIIMTDPGRLTVQQTALYAHRDAWPMDEVAAFLVGSLPPMLCRGFSHPALHVCVVTSGAPILTLAHELGHLLGLEHVEDPGNLMAARGPRDPTACLDAAQVQQLLESPLLRNS